MTDKANPTRDEFAALLEETFLSSMPAEGSVIKGKVVAIENDLAIVDVGLKTEGRIPVREFEGAGEEIKVGDEVEVYLERIENAMGEAVLSREKARREEAWERLEKSYEANEPVKGQIFGRVKGGFTVDLGGAVAFLPGSQVDIRPIRDITPLMNVEQPFRILKMDRRRGNIVVSRRAILEESREEQRAELVQNLAEGQVIEGMVKNITDYGAFVDLGGIDGLLHVTDMSWKRVNHPSDILSVGETVQVQIIKINSETQRISLGMKQLAEDPWKAVAEKYPVDSRITGRVTNITDYGAFVELEEGIDGLIHISQLSSERVSRVRDVVNVGDTVKAQVVRIEADERRIGLSMRALQEEEQGYMSSSDVQQAMADLRPGDDLVNVGSLMDSAFAAVVPVDAEEAPAADESAEESAGESPAESETAQVEPEVAEEASEESEVAAVASDADGAVEESPAEPAATASDAGESAGESPVEPVAPVAEDAAGEDDAASAEGEADAAESEKE